MKEEGYTEGIHILIIILIGQHYCVECARHFIDVTAKEEHLRTKLHKRRVKILLTEQPYTQKEADAAGGLIS